MSDRTVREELADGVGYAIEQLIAEAAQDGSAVSPAVIVEKVLAKNPGSTMSRVQLAEAILRAAALRGLNVQVGRDA